MMDPLRIEIYRSATAKGQPWRWRLRGGNGRIVATGHEGFASRRNARRAIVKLQDRIERCGTTLKILDP